MLYEEAKKEIDEFFDKEVDMLERFEKFKSLPTKEMKESAIGKFNGISKEQSDKEMQNMKALRENGKLKEIVGIAFKSCVLRYSK